MPKMYHLASPRLASLWQALIYMEHQRIPHCKVILNYTMHEPRHLPQPGATLAQNFHERKNSHTLHRGKRSMLTFHKLFVKHCLLLRTMTEHPTSFSGLTTPGSLKQFSCIILNSGNDLVGKRESLGYSFQKQESLTGL